LPARRATCDKADETAGDGGNPLARSFLGIIGGSGVYDMPGIEDARWQRLHSPWGEPSDEARVGRFGGVPVAFLPRHGRGHRLSPSDIDYRANIDALKRLGVTDIVSISAVGSLKEELAPGTFVAVDQFIDRTFARAKSFFGAGCVAHVSMAHPVAPLLSARLADAADAAGVPCRRGGTLVVMEGPQFSTLAESRLYRSWGADLIGMTAMPEAKLAREAEISYATLAMVTDYDSWHPNHDRVDVASVVRVLNENREHAQALIGRFLKDFPTEHEPCPIGSDRALDHAIMTAPAMRDRALTEKLDAVAGRVLKG
jgi:5'-methylthioadenosine phosphorylase